MKRKNLNILFIIRSASQFHYYSSIVKSLLNRGHKVRTLFDKSWTDEAMLSVVDEFKRNELNFEYGWAVRRKDKCRNILFYSREMLGYRKYLLIKGQSEFYKERWNSYLPKSVRKTLRSNFARFIVKTAPFGWILRGVEKALPPSKQIINDIKKFNPDVILAAPVNLRFSSADLEYLKAAKELNIPTVLPVLSWDNLTTKGLIHIIPDLLLVWNEIQAKEAEIHQSIPKKKISIIGASVFDKWFSKMGPTLSREEFCKKNGLDPGRPIILYLSTSINLAGDESWLVVKLRKVLDKSGYSKIKRVQMIVRPHPGGNKDIYKKMKMDNMAFVPEIGNYPNTKGSSELFYDSIHHSEFVVVGVNTSAIIEAMIMGKRGMVVLTDKYKKTQIETVHFRQLFDADALHVVKSIKEFPSAVGASLNGEDPGIKGRKNFIKKYIRPLGLEISAGEAASEFIEELVFLKKENT